jgi:phage gp37-like protein
MTAFSTVSLMRESPEIIGRFVRYYLAAGAEEVMVFHDGPAPFPLENPGMTLVECDAAFWAKACGERPVALEDRQSAVYGLGQRRCRTEWLLVVDADEYVFGDRSIPSFLGTIPEDAESVSLPTAEAVWGPGDQIDAPFGSTHFRLEWRRPWLWRLAWRPLYGGMGADMRRGLLGHVRGKQFLRADRRYSAIRNHDVLRDGRVLTRPAAEVAPALSGMFLGHFDAISRARWTQKWRQRLTGETVARGMAGGRTRQMSRIGERLGRGEKDARALFRTFYGLSRGQYAVLNGLGFAFQKNIFPDDVATHDDTCQMARAS